MMALIAIGAALFGFGIGAKFGWNRRIRHEANCSDYWTQDYRDAQFRTWLNGKEYP